MESCEWKRGQSSKGIAVVNYGMEENVFLALDKYGCEYLDLSHGKKDFAVTFL